MATTSSKVGQISALVCEIEQCINSCMFQTNQKSQWQFPCSIWLSRSTWQMVLIKIKRLHCPAQALCLNLIKDLYYETHKRLCSASGLTITWTWARLSINLCARYDFWWFKEKVFFTIPLGWTRRALAVLHSLQPCGLTPTYIIVPQPQAALEPKMRNGQKWSVRNNTAHAESWR